MAREAVSEALYSCPYAPYTPREHNCLYHYSGIKHASSVIRQYIRRSIYSAKNSAVQTQQSEPIASMRCKTNSFISSSSPLRRNSPDVNQTRNCAGKSRKAMPSGPPRGSRMPYIRNDAANAKDLQKCLLQNQQHLVDLQCKLQSILKPYAIATLSTEKRRHGIESAGPCLVRNVSNFVNSANHDAPLENICSSGTSKRIRNCMVSEPCRSKSQIPILSASGHMERNSEARGRSRSVPASSSKVFRDGGSGAAREQQQHKALEPFKTRRQTLSATSVEAKTRSTDRSMSKTSGKPLPFYRVSLPKEIGPNPKSAASILADKMDQWACDLPIEICARVTSAVGVEEKFLALRDCAIALCAAAEERAISIQAIRRNSAGRAKTYQNQTHLMESALVDLQGGVLAALAKVKQLDGLIRLKMAETAKQLVKPLATYHAPVSAECCYAPHTSIYSAWPTASLEGKKYTFEEFIENDIPECDAHYNVSWTHKAVKAPSSRSASITCEMENKVSTRENTNKNSQGICQRNTASLQCLPLTTDYPLNGIRPQSSRSNASNRRNVSCHPDFVEDAMISTESENNTSLKNQIVTTATQPPVPSDVPVEHSSHMGSQLSFSNSQPLTDCSRIKGEESKHTVYNEDVSWAADFVSRWRASRLHGIIPFVQ